MTWFLTRLKKCLNWIDKNPMFAVSITLGFILLAWKFRQAIRYNLQNLLGMEKTMFPSPLSVSAAVSLKFAIKDNLHPKGHNGVDLRIKNEKIYSPLSGVVLMADQTKEASADKGGKELIILHENGFRTGYAHLSDIKVNKGDKVQAGQLVAVSGNTGTNTTGAHLHFTLTDPNLNKIDPEHYFNFSNPVYGVTKQIV